MRIAPPSELRAVISGPHRGHHCRVALYRLVDYAEGLSFREAEVWAGRRGIRYPRKKRSMRKILTVAAMLLIAVAANAEVLSCRKGTECQSWAIMLGDCPAGWSPSAAPCPSGMPTPTPTPTTTPTPRVTPGPAASGPIPIGADPYGRIPCFQDNTGNRVENIGGAFLCPSWATKFPWMIASSVESNTSTTPGIGTYVVPGLAERHNVTQPLYGQWWQMSTTINTVDNPCPVTCDGWYWGMVAMTTVPGEYRVSDDLTFYVAASWDDLRGTGKARLGVQFAFWLPDGSGWAELDVNLGELRWPHPDTRPEYASVAPVDIYKAGDGLRYYVVFSGPGLGFTDALTQRGTIFWRIPVTALVRKARADNPAAFPLADEAIITSAAVSREHYGQQVQTIYLLEPPHLWARGPQDLPTPPAKAGARALAVGPQQFDRTLAGHMPRQKQPTP